MCYHQENISLYGVVVETKISWPFLTLLEEKKNLPNDLTDKEENGGDEERGEYLQVLYTPGKYYVCIPYKHGLGSIVQRVPK